MKPRPRIYFPLAALPLTVAAVAVELNRHGWNWAVWFFVAPVAIYAVSWLLFPYWRRARHVLLPSDNWFAGMRRFNLAIRRVPVIGSLLRFGDKLTGDAGARAAREQEMHVRRERANRQSRDD